MKMKRCLVTVLCLMVAHNILVAKELTLDDVFPTDRVLDVQITIDERDWDTIRYQSLNFFEALQESRKYGPTDSPYTYVEASVSIDGVEFPQVGIRKKGFLGSLNSNRPSLKIKLNHVDKKGQIGGATNLTFNNNQQDISLISQFMGYALFNAAGSPAPRCAYAKLTVNGTSLGIYSHVERIHRPLLKRAFGNDNGTLYEGQVVGFFPGWEGSFEHKLGDDKLGRKKIKKLIEVLEGENENIEQAIGRLVDLDSFYTFWAMEGLLSFWDGYSGNKNNFFIYLNPETDKFHFIPWGADCMFERYSPIRNDRYDPLSVKKQGLIAHRLYQLESGRQRYRQTLRNIMEQHWDEKALLVETERIEALVRPHLAIGDKTEADFDRDEARGWIEWAKNASPEEREGAINSEKFRSLSLKVQEAIMEGIEKLKEIGEKGELSEEAGKDESDKYDDEDEEKGQEEQLAYRFVRSLEERRRFIRQRRADITEEIANGMPRWEARPDEPFVMPSADGFELKPKANSIWSAAGSGDLKAVKQHLAKGIDINAKDSSLGITPLASAILQDQTQMVEFLIQQSADVNAKNRDGGTALHTAAFLGQYEVAELLVQKGADVNAKNEDGDTPISSTMADWGTTEFVAQLLQIQVDREKVETGRAKVAELLSQQGAQTGFAGFAGNDIWTAAVSGDIEAVKQQLAKGVDVNAKNKDGASALHAAAIVGQYEVAELLIQKGADVNFRSNDGGTALHAAAFLGQYEVAELLIQKGADVNFRSNDGTTAMNALKTDWGTVQFIAQLLQIQVDREKVETGRTKVAKLLSQQGANTNFSGPVGSDIWAATGAGDIEAVKQHLAKGMDVDAKNKDGATALHVAAILGQYEVAELLIQKGANVNVSGDDGGTALHAAAFLGQYEVAKLLVQKGADVNARKNDGVTAMDVLKVDWGTTEFIARLLQIQVDREKVEAGRAQIVELLRQHGTK
ncbi:hypothetical protein CMK16_02470 [Candidatus Poribacteria bacterium]|nr:hypothetical protein [Candidatus Poribacteria bacterium]